MPTIKEKRASCKRNGKVYDIKTKRCRESKVKKKTPVRSKSVPKKMTVKQKRASCKRSGKVYDVKTKRCRESKVKKKSKKKTPVRSKSINLDRMLQKHQKMFAEAFTNSTKRGGVAIHGVGSGKTLTAIAVSQKWLQKNPTKSVIVITPASLISNFEKELVKFNIKNIDKYEIVSYQTYANKPSGCKNKLLIVDEVHNIRTEVDKLVTVKQKKKDPQTGRVIIVKKKVRTGKTAKAIIKCAIAASKILLLTATHLLIVNMIWKTFLQCCKDGCQETGVNLMLILPVPRISRGNLSVFSLIMIQIPIHLRQISRH